MRQVSLAALVMLVVQYALGITLNLYIAVPAADAHAGLTQEIASGPGQLPWPGVRRPWPGRGAVAQVRAPRGARQSRWSHLRRIWPSRNVVAVIAARTLRGSRIHRDNFRMMEFVSGLRCLRGFRDG